MLHVLFLIIWLTKITLFSALAWPDEDRKSLRSDRLPLLDQIGDVISQSERLYSWILHCGDMHCIMAETKKREGDPYALLGFLNKQEKAVIFFWYVKRNQEFMKFVCY